MVRLILLAAAAGLFALAWWIAGPDIRALNWPVVKAVVEEVDTRQTQDNEGTALEIPYARFRYTVNGKEYRVTENLGLATNLKSSIRSALVAYPARSTVEVRYDPENPARLYPFFRLGWLSGGALILMLMIALAMVAVALAPRGKTA